MTQSTARKRIWGWFFFDWASQPFNTLILTFIFGPYVVELMGDGSAAQTAWTSGIGIAGLLIAIMAPVLGAMADSSGTRMFWIRVFSVAYVVGSFALWYAVPGDFSIWFILWLAGRETADQRPPPDIRAAPSLVHPRKVPA